MELLLSGLKLLTALIILPFAAGLLFLRVIPGEKKRWHMIFITGWLIDMSAFFLISLICMFFIKQKSFCFCSGIFSVTEFLLCAAGIFYAVKKKELKGIFKKEIRTEGYINRRNLPFIAVFALLLAYILYGSAAYDFFDTDNAYYVTQSLIAQQQGAMYTMLPYTGGVTALDYRHALAVLPLYFAYLADFSGIHATILQKSIMPFFIIPLYFICWYEAAAGFYKKDEDKDSLSIPFFMCMMAVFLIYGNVSAYTAEHFLIARTWQGKAVFAGVAVPLMFAGLLKLGDEEKNIYPVFLLILTGILSGMCSSLGTILSAGAVAGGALILALVKKDIKTALKGFACCIPQLLYMILYVML